jgi:phosphate transport system substrate-binding protein
MSGLVAVLAVGSLVLSACGSDNNTAATTSAAATSTTGSTAGSGAPSGATTFEGAGFACATGDLRSSGSTAQGKVKAGRWVAISS